MITYFNTVASGCVVASCPDPEVVAAGPLAVIHIGADRVYATLQGRNATPDNVLEFCVSNETNTLAISSDASRNLTFEDDCIPFVFALQTLT